MSALELHDHEDQVGVSHYAPPRVRGRADETTIRPILERLSRGENDDNSHPASAQPFAEDAPLATRDVQRAPKIPLSMAGRLAIAVGLVAALAIPAVAFLTPRAEQTAPAAPVETPKKVHTISFQAKKPITTPELAAASAVKQPASPLVQPTPPMAPPALSAEQSVSLPAQGAPASGAGDVDQAKPAQPRAESAPAVTAPLKSWAMFPVDTASAGWTPAAQPPNQGAVEPPTKKSIHEPAAKHTTHTRHHHHVRAAQRVRHHRRHYVRRHHHVRGHAKPQPAQQVAPPADSQTTAVEQTKPNPIQAAINALLGKQ